MKVDLPIGFRFIHGTDILEVKESKYCTRCHFFEEPGCSGAAFACTAVGREDGKSVRFIKVGVIKVGEMQHE